MTLSFKGRLSLLCAVIVFVLFLQVPAGMGREIVDMSGNRHTLPDKVTRVYSASPPGTYLLYAVKPESIVGLNFPLWQNEKLYTTKQYQQLPVIGGMVGQGRTVNREVLLQAKPDCILVWCWKQGAANKKFENSLRSLGVPLVSVHLESIYDYPQAITFLADLLDEQQRGEKLTRYAQEALKQAEQIVRELTPAEKIRVYYAEGLDGLSTEASNSFHVELIPLAGGVNVHQGEAASEYGMEKISMEKLMLYDPDCILVKDQRFFKQVWSDPKWQVLRAVQNKRVYLIPHDPFNWFDRPPSFMRLLGIKWMLSILHPQKFPLDMVAETQTFYKMFLGVDITVEQAKEILEL